LTSTIPPAEDTREKKSPDSYEKLTTSKLAKALGLKTADLVDRLLDEGFLRDDDYDDDRLELTAAGKQAGGKIRYSKKFGPYFLWPRDLKIK
jgi:hypothetical protein